MTLNDLLRLRSVDPERVVVLRHRPSEPALNKVMPWLAAERPDLFDAYQGNQGEVLERTLQSASHVVSFLGREPGTATFVGLYAVSGWESKTPAEFNATPAVKELVSLGMRPVADGEARETLLGFNLSPTDFYPDWKGRLVVGWPPPERSWWRRAHKNVFPVVAIHADSVFEAAMPDWDELGLTWDQLAVLPTRWKDAMRQWRGIYLIHDSSDGRSYVGSAAGHENILGRWLGYASTGHGGNVRLRGRDPRNFRFTILQRVSPDTEVADIVRLEASWKERLHTRGPFGLNDN